MNEDQAPITDIAVLATMSPQQIFAPGMLTKVLDKIEEESRAEAKAADPSTSEGRERLRSNAYRIAKSRVSLDKMGLALTETWRKSTKAVNEERAAMEVRLKALEADVRKPLTAFEEREKARVLAHENMLADMNALTVLFPGKDAVPTAADVLVNLEKARTMGEGRDWQEFAERAADTKARAIDVLTGMHARAVTVEAEAKELAELRELRARVQAEEAAREVEERRKAEEARIAAVAEAARLQAEEEAKAREAELQRKAEEQAAAAKRREEEHAAMLAEREAEAKRQQEAHAAWMAKREEEHAAELARVQEQARQQEEQRKLREAQVEHERQEAARVMEAARKRDEQAKIDAAVAEANRKAVEAEEKRHQQRQAEQAQAERALLGAQAEAEAKAANKAHRGRINSAVALKLMEVSSVSQVHAHKLVEAIAKGEIDHVSIAY